MRRLNESEIEDLAQTIVDEVKKRIEALDLAGVEFRRDFDGVSQDTYLLQKLIGEALADTHVGSSMRRGMNTLGLVICTDDETYTPKEFRQAAIDAGIPESVVDGKTKLTDHFSPEYIESKRNPRGTK
jgi:hypothetical protein